MIRIEPARLASASWVTANLRPEDHAEIFCQLPDNFPSAAMAQLCILNGDAFVAYDADQPVALYGTTPMTPSCFSVWAMFTKGFRRVVPAVSRHFLQDIVPARIEQGFRSAEARCMVGNDKAMAWIKALGGVPMTPPFEFGKADERFILFRWTVAGYRAMSRKTR